MRYIIERYISLTLSIIYRIHIILFFFFIDLYVFWILLQYLSWFDFLMKVWNILRFISRLFSSSISLKQILYLYIRKLTHLYAVVISSHFFFFLIFVIFLNFEEFFWWQKSIFFNSLSFLIFLWMNTSKIFCLALDKFFFFCFIFSSSKIGEK